MQEDLILPEGFEEGQDIFELSETEEAPTIEQSEEGEVIDAAAEDVDDADPGPTIEQKADDAPTKAKIKVKFNHEERELDEDEAAPLIQKGLNYDKIVHRSKELETKLSQSEKLAQMMGYRDSSEMISAAEANFIEQRVAQLVDEGLHEALARDIVQRDLEKNTQPAAPQKSSYEDDLDEFVRLNPGVTQLPEEVVAAVSGGIPLTVAYERYKTKQIQDELKILKQNQSSAAKAPVGSATKHGSTKQKAKDAFEMGFDADDW